MEMKMAENSMSSQKDNEEMTFIKSMGFCSFGIGANVAAIDVKNGKIVRTRPLHYDWKYSRQEINPWKEHQKYGKTAKES